MKRSPGKIFAKIFLRSIIVVIFLFTVGIISYKAAIKFWQPKKEALENDFQEKPISSIPDQVKIEEISYRLLYGYEEENQEITKMVLGVLNGHSKKLTYITLPLHSQISISSSLYKNVVADYPEMPQFFKLSALSTYLKGEEVFRYGVMIVEDILGIDIHYYMAIPGDTYNKIFNEKQIKQKDGYASVPMETFSKEHLKTIKSLDTMEKASTYLEEIFPLIITDITLEEKKQFLDYYMGVKSKDITFELIEGSNKNSGYTIDLEKAAQRLAEITSR